MKIYLFYFFISFNLFCQTTSKERLIGSWKHISSNRENEKLIKINKFNSSQNPSIIFLSSGKLLRFFPDVLVKNKYTKTKNEEWIIFNDSIIHFKKKNKTFRAYQIREVTDTVLFLQKIKIQL